MPHLTGAELSSTRHQYLTPSKIQVNVCYTRYFRTHLDHQKLMVFTILSNENNPFHFAPRLFVARERT